MRQLITVCALFLLACTACGEPEDRRLLGNWRAVSVTEGGDSVRLDPAQIAFRFTPDNRYRFESTLRHREAGTWSYANERLIATDTTRQDIPQRVVAVDKLTPDSLVLRMTGASAERIVVLLKE